MEVIDFGDAFRALTGNDPFPWQRALYDHFAIGGFPASCNLPTGLGKTNVIAVWLVALAKHPDVVPRRLVYVVNRRTVVDQTTEEIVQMRDRLTVFGPLLEPLRRLRESLEALSGTPANGPLAISTLRGQFADNREWSADPSRAAVICGTVDMIGSRLLFAGYGVGFKGKPLHAGFLGQDVLLVHDEAHLEPAFQQLLKAIEKEQQRCGEFAAFRVIELSATSGQRGEKFELTPADKTNPIVIKRIQAKKAVHFHPLKDDRKLADQIGDLALVHKNSGHAVLVFLRKVDDVQKIVERLGKEKLKVQQLTGTLRGFERDALAESDPIFARFLPKPKVTPESGSVFFVCTSAGEVGVNISADHLICDLSTFESMAQRFGRVNRFGDRDDTRIDIVHPTEFDDGDEYELRQERTLTLLRQLDGDGSPQALGELDAKERIDAFAPTPTILPVTDILFDAWALTTIREKLPGRPPVEPYLHGISDYDPPQTTIAWREEVEVLTLDVLEHNKLQPDEILEMYPLKPHEELTGPTYGKNKVLEQLQAIAARDATRELDQRLSAWVIDQDGTVMMYSLQQLVENDVPLGGRTVLLPPHAGGLSGGLLKGDEPFVEAILYDVSERWYANPERTIVRRTRVWDGEDIDEKSKGMRLIRRIDLPSPEDDDDAEGRAWHWFTRPLSADDDGSKTSKHPITWLHHTRDVENRATKLADALLKDQPDFHQALVLAARFHDLGKKRIAWQRSIGNPTPDDWHAKSGKDPITGKMWRPLELTPYRHEFGSLIDLENEEEFKQLGSEDQKELIRHLIAVHHGYGRPHFPRELAFDPERPQTAADQVAIDVPSRFGRLQRKYGRWGLAYLESLLRAADWAASAEPLKEMEP